jgi:hypothetical protein
VIIVDGEQTQQRVGNEGCQVAKFRLLGGLDATWRGQDARRQERRGALSDRKAAVIKRYR